jgi:hypothetical protein
MALWDNTTPLETIVMTAFLSHFLAKPIQVHKQTLS